jgi:hypothetical protein
LVITNGCSFSSGTHTWTACVESHYRGQNPRCEFLHLAVPSQGNELIQKKTLRAVQQAQSRFNPEEIAVFVMWTTHDRKAYYLPETSTARLTDLWSLNSEHRWRQQFADLDNRIVPGRSGTGVVELGSGPGWYHMHGSTMNSDIISKIYYTLVHDLELGVHTTLENQLFLELFLDQAGVQYQPMMISSGIYQDMFELRDHNLVEHLWASISWTKYITEGQSDFLRAQPDSARYFYNDHEQPNSWGNQLWFEPVLLPRISRASSSAMI